MLRSSGRGRYEERPCCAERLIEEFFERGIRVHPVIANPLQRVEAISDSRRFERSLMKGNEISPSSLRGSQNEPKQSLRKGKNMKVFTGGG